MQHPTFSSTAFFYDRSADRATYSGDSGAEIEGQSWRGGHEGGVGVGVSLAVLSFGGVCFWELALASWTGGT